MGVMSYNMVFGSNALEGLAASTFKAVVCQLFTILDAINPKWPLAYRINPVMLNNL
jgi:hypothetical protein